MLNPCNVCFRGGSLGKHLRKFIMYCREPEGPQAALILPMRGTEYYMWRHEPGPVPHDGYSNIYSLNSIFSCLLWPDAELGIRITVVYKLDKDPAHNETYYRGGWMTNKSKWPLSPPPQKQNFISQCHCETKLETWEDGVGGRRPGTEQAERSKISIKRTFQVKPQWWKQTKLVLGRCGGRAFPAEDKTSAKALEVKLCSRTEEG